MQDNINADIKLVVCKEVDRFLLWHDMNKVLAILPWLVIKGGEAERLFIAVWIPFR
jgi:hypothetical protein